MVLNGLPLLRQYQLGFRLNSKETANFPCLLLTHTYSIHP